MAKPVLRSGYTFTPGSKQISFAGVPGFNINGLLAVFNRTAGAMIFDATEPTLDFASVSGSTVTLKYDTNGMSAGDVLTVVYDEQVQDGLSRTYSVTSTAAQAGFPVSGYGCLSVSLEGTFSANISIEFSDNTTDGIDGTWAVGIGCPINSAGSQSQPQTSNGTTGTKYIYNASYGLWARVKALNYSSGTATVRVVCRTSPLGERAVTVGNNINLNSTSNTIGGFYPTASNINAGVAAARIKSAAGTNATIAATGARNLYGGIISNAGTAVAFLKLFDKASAPVLGTDTPVLVIPISPGATLSLERTIPRRFTNGIAYAITGGKADADTTAVAADDIQGELIYA